MSMKWHGGKGSKQRTTDYASYNDNYDKIFEKKMGRDELVKIVIGDNTTDLLKGDVIEWIKFDSKTIQITIVAYGSMDDKVRAETFQVPADVFEKTYKPAFK